MKNLILLILFSLPSWMSESYKIPETTNIVEQISEEELFLCYSSSLTVTNVTITLPGVEFQVQEFETATISFYCCPLMLLSGLPSCTVSGISLNPASGSSIIDPPYIINPKDKFVIKFEVKEDVIVERIGVDEETGKEKSKEKIKIFAGKYFVDSSGENNIKQVVLR